MGRGSRLPASQPRVGAKLHWGEWVGAASAGPLLPLPHPSRVLLLLPSAAKCCGAITGITQTHFAATCLPVRQSHDVGFIILTSFGDALEAALEPTAAPEAGAGWYRAVILHAAASLA